MSAKENGGVRQGDLLARLWPVVDPALDVLPADELLTTALAALEQAFGAAATAVVLASGERFGSAEDDAAWEQGPRMELPLHDGHEDVGRIEITMPGGVADAEERFALRFAATRFGRAVARPAPSTSPPACSSACAPMPARSSTSTGSPAR